MQNKIKRIARKVLPVITVAVLILGIYTLSTNSELGSTRGGGSITNWLPGGAENKDKERSRFAQDGLEDMQVSQDKLGGYKRFLENKQELIGVNSVSSVQKPEVNSDGAKRFIDSVLNMLAKEYNGLEDVSKVSSIVSEDSSIETQIALDFIGATILDFNETWYFNALSCENNVFYILTISRVASNNDNIEKLFDVAMKWQIRTIKDGYEIKEVSIVDFNSLDKAIEEIEKQQKLTVYNTVYATGREYNTEKVGYEELKTVEGLVDSRVVAVVSNTCKGSGVFISKNTILTAYSILYESEDATVITSFGKEYVIREILIADPAYNIAVVRIDTPENESTVATIADTLNVDIGSQMYRVSIAEDGISNICNSSISVFETEFTYFSLPVVADSIGSPLFDIHGNIVGMVGFIYDGFTETCKSPSVSILDYTINKALYGDITPVMLDSMVWCLGKEAVSIV